jgi:hypothetical protein
LAEATHEHASRTKSHNKSHAESANHTLHDQGSPATQQTGNQTGNQTFPATGFERSARLHPDMGFLARDGFCQDSAKAGVV